MPKSPIHRSTRRQACAALGALLLAAGAGSALADAAYPTKAITLVVPQAAGGANDVIARVVAQRLSEQMGQPVIVDNRPGAGGTLATAATARAKHDGYTLLLTADSAHVIGPALYRNPGSTRSRISSRSRPWPTAGYVLVANPSFPANNVTELIALAKARPGQYAIASAGNGTLNHLIGEQLQKAAGIQLQHVPYKGSAAAATDVVGGQVPLSVQSLPSSIAFIKGGKLKVLGVVNERRVAALPGVPTIGETIKGFGQAPWYALFAPAAHPGAHRRAPAGRSGPRAGPEGRRGAPGQRGLRAVQGHFRPAGRPGAGRPAQVGARGEGHRRDAGLSLRFRTCCACWP